MPELPPMCRLDSSTTWIIFVPREIGRGGRMVGTERMTPEERERWRAAVTRQRDGVEHPDGWFDAGGAYRHINDEAAALERWRARQETP